MKTESETEQARKSTLIVWLVILIYYIIFIILYTIQVARGRKGDHDTG